MDGLGLEAFLAIVQTRSLTKAAELLHLSQSTVSYRLKNLERNLGQVLVERSKGVASIQLTSFGHSFLPLAERWHLLNREVGLLQAEGPQIRLKVGVADSLNVYVLPPLYRAILAECPQVRLQIRTQHTDESYDSIERREVDIAFVKLERVLPNVQVTPFYVDEMVLVRLKSGQRRAEPVAPDNLAAEEELFFNWGPAYELWHGRWWDSYPASRLQVDTAALLFSLMTAPEQWAIVPQSIACAFAAPERFVVQTLTEPPPPRICYKVVHKLQDPAKAAVLAKIEELAQKLYSDNQAEY